MPLMTEAGWPQEPPVYFSPFVSSGAGLERVKFEGCALEDAEELRASYRGGGSYVDSASITSALSAAFLFSSLVIPRWCIAVDNSRIIVRWSLQYFWPTPGYRVHPRDLTHT